MNVKITAETKLWPPSSKIIACVGVEIEMILQTIFTGHLHRCCTNQITALTLLDCVINLRQLGGN